jgi:WD40 repeat protein
MASDARFSPDATMLAFAPSGRRLRLCDAATGASRKIETRSSTVAFSPDGRTLASGHGNVVGLYDCSTCALQRQYVLRAHDDVIAVAFSPAGRLVFTKSDHERVSLCYTTTDGELVRHDLDIFGLGRGTLIFEFSPDGSLLAVVGSNSNVALYDTATATRRLIPRP